MKAIVYSTPKCVFCSRAMNLLKSHNVEVEKIMIEADTNGLPTQTTYNTHMYEEIQQKARDNYDDIMRICDDNGKQMKSVPQVIIDDSLIGGYEETEAWCKQQFEE